MALGTQFQSTGAIPKYSQEGLKRVSGLGLNAAPVMGSNPITSPITQGKVQGFVPQKQPQATTPLKKTITTNADGTSTTHEYHAETKPTVKGTTTTTPPANTIATPPPTTTPPVITTPPVSSTNPAVQAMNVGQAGQQTTNEAATQARLVEQSKAPIEAYTQAHAEYQKRVKDLADFEASLANTYRGTSAQGIPLPDIQGQEGNIAKWAESRRAALQNAITESEQAMSYANTQQGLQTTAAQGAYSGAQTQAQRGLGAQGQVLTAGLYSPASIGTVPYSALTGQSQGMLGGSEGFATLGKLEAQKATAGQQYQQVEQYKSAHQQAQNLQSQLGDLITTFGLNPSDINLANAGIQKIASNVSDPKYKILSNYLADVASRYSQILTPAGGSSTDTTRAVAAGMLDGIASGKSIIEVMNALDQQAQAVIAGVTTSNTGTPSGSSTGTVQAGGFNFKQVNGKWIPA